MDGQTVAREISRFTGTPPEYFQCYDRPPMSLRATPLVTNGRGNVDIQMTRHSYILERDADRNWFYDYQGEQ